MIGANPAYVLGQLERALLTAEGGADASTRARAEGRLERWLAVLDGIRGGTLQLGSRVPVAGAPEWATLEVVTGGFATGALRAGGPLLPHELERRARLDTPEPPEHRLALNLSYLSDPGRRELAEQRASGNYRIGVPEEGALLVLSWLFDHGELTRAEALLGTLLPYFDRLRFYPVPAATPLAEAQLVRLETIAEVSARLSGLAPKRQVSQMNEALTVWAPLSDRAVTLFLETVCGPPPSLHHGPDGRAHRDRDGKPILEGGWPLEQVPPGWQERAQALLQDYERAKAEHRLARKHLRPKENLAILIEHLRTAVRDPEQLDRRARGMIRKVLASCVEARGVPGSERHQKLRAMQAQQATLPSHAAISKVLVGRLGAHPKEGGLAAVEALAVPIAAEESLQLSGVPIPRSLLRRIERCLEAPVEELIERKLVRSGEVLAKLMPQITAQIRAANVADPELRRLYAAIYAAFRRRRSLLLLDLSQQVRIEELPWVAAIEPQRKHDLGALATARQALESLVKLDLVSFPQTIMPNKLLTEIGALAKSAGLTLPLVDELAADIFLGTFSAKYVEAAKIAARLLGGTLYARYYALPIARVQAIDDLSKEQPFSKTFAALCVERAGPPGKARSTAYNGKIIEQEQLLTTHNLATLFDCLSLRTALPLMSMAEGCFNWIARALSVPRPDWRSQLQIVKDVAYAWRQMLFYLSFVDPKEQLRFVEWAGDVLDEERLGLLEERLAPAMLGLTQVIKGESFAADGQGPRGAKQLLAWATERHWLLPPGK